MATIKRMNVAVNCSDLDKSLAFYRSFFGSEPTKVKDNYAMFELLKGISLNSIQVNRTVKVKQRD